MARTRRPDPSARRRARSVLLFDAVRVLPLDGGPIGDEPTEPAGCCDASGRGRATSVGGMVLVGLALRRRRRAQ
jgi:hypothetical protein